MSLALLWISMGINFAKGFLSGVKESNEAYYKASDYENQAEIFKKNADAMALHGAINEDVLRSKNRFYISNGVAAANEVGMGESPTMMTALTQTNTLLEQNVLNERYKMESEAEKYLYQARVMAHNARQMRKKSDKAFRSGLVEGIGSALGSL